MSRSRIAYAAALSGWFGLFFLLLVWFGWLAPARLLPTSLVLLFGVGPLLLPLRGLLHGRPYTFAWTSFLSLAYFTHGVVVAWPRTPERWLGLLEVLFSLLLFTGAVWFARYRARELRAAAPPERD